MQQNIHLLTNTNVGLPTDLWVPSTDVIRPKRSRQIAIGTAIAIKDKYELLKEHGETQENWFTIPNSNYRYTFISLKHLP